MKIMHDRLARLGMVFVGAFLTLGADVASAQNAPVNPADVYPADTLVARFEREGDAAYSPARQWIIGVLRRSTSSPARVDSLLTGLERVARTNTSVGVRSFASSLLARGGEQGTLHPRMNVVARLTRVYAANPERGAVRLGIIYAMALQEDRRGAAQFLKRLAMEPDARTLVGPDDMGNPRTDAIARLAEMGEEGRTVLQELHRDAQRLSPAARSMLQGMAARGFPVRNARPPGFPSQPARP